MNLIPKVCEMLGLEIGEEFKIKGYSLSLWKLDPHRGLLVKHNEMREWEEANGERYIKLLNGFYKIEHLPFEPKEEEEYWIVYWDVNGKKICTTNLVWRNYVSCFADKYCGNCFRTKAEAEVHKYEIYEKLTGRKWEEKCDS